MHVREGESERERAPCCLLSVKFKIILNFTERTNTALLHLKPYYSEVPFPIVAFKTEKEGMPSLELLFGLSALGYCTNVILQHGQLHGRGPTPQRLILRPQNTKMTYYIGSQNGHQRTL